MSLLSNILRAAPSCNSPQDLFNNLARRFAQLRVLNLAAGNQAAVDRLPQRLADKTTLDCIGFDQIEDRPEGTGKSEALGRLYVALCEVRVMKHQDPGNFAVAPEMRRHGRVEPGRVKVREVIQAEGSLVAVDALDFLAPVSGPKSPKDEVGPIGCRKQRKPIDTTEPLHNTTSFMKLYRNSSGLLC